MKQQRVITRIRIEDNIPARVGQICRKIARLFVMEQTSKIHIERRHGCKGSTIEYRRHKRFYIFRS